MGVLLPARGISLMFNCAQLLIAIEVNRKAIMKSFPFQFLSFILLSVLVAGTNSANSAITQVSTLEAQLPTAGEAPTPDEVETPIPDGVPSIAPMPNTSDFDQPWQERDEEIQQQNQEEESQINEEYNAPAPENVEEPDVAPTLDEDPY